MQQRNDSKSASFLHVLAPITRSWAKKESERWQATNTIVGYVCRFAVRAFLVIIML